MAPKDATTVDPRVDATISDLIPIVARRSLAEEAADRLRDLILMERLDLGQPVHERELAGALVISRTPLREALRLFERGG